MSRSQSECFSQIDSSQPRGDLREGTVITPVLEIEEGRHRGFATSLKSEVNLSYLVIYSPKHLLRATPTCEIWLLIACFRLASRYGVGVGWGSKR